MTFEHKIVASLADIRAISYECNGCRARVTFSPDKFIEPTNICFQCRNPWQEKLATAVPNFSADLAVARFIKSLNVLRTLFQEGSMGFTIILEFEEPKQ
jgi:hypothetical protein